MKLIGAIHKSVTKESLFRMKAAGLTGARIHLSKMTHLDANKLIAMASDLNLEVYLDTRGNKPTITSILLPKFETTVDKVNINLNDRILFQIQSPSTAKLSGYLAIFTLSYIPEILGNSTGSKLSIDDGNIIIQIDRVFFEKDQIIAFEAVVVYIDLEKVDAIYHEGISSFDLPLHSNATELFTPYDIACLEAITSNNQNRVAYIGASFAETENQIIQAHMIIKNMGYSKAKIVAKIETLIGVGNTKMIAGGLENLYPNDGELWIARGDLAVALHGKRANAMKATEKVMFDDLKNNNVRVIVATDVANSLRNYRDPKKTAILTAMEKAQILKELKQGAGGFVLAGEMYAGPSHQGEYGQHIVEAVNKTVIAAISGNNAV